MSIAKQQTVLIVDDMPENIKILGELLRSKYSLHVATNGEKALNIAMSESPPDLILLDIMMPGMDGYGVCRRLKETQQTKDIPVIFLSGKTETEDIVKGFHLGAVDYVTKPFRVEELIARVRTHLALKKAREELEVALANVKQLSGMLPICANCKKIRDDKGYWQQVEEFVTDRSDAKFSHGLCPECVKKLYPDMAEEILK